MSNRDWFAEIMAEMRQLAHDGGLTDLNPALKRAAGALARDYAAQERHTATIHPFPPRDSHPH